MPGHPSENEGVEDEKGEQPDSGLDAKLDRAVSTDEADAFLMVVGGNQSGRIYPLSHNTVFIGRADDSDICISDPSVSAHHARVLNASRGFEIEDLQSTNGTFVGGRRVERMHLENGDRIALGNVEFKFLFDRRTDATLAVIPPDLTGAGARGGALVRHVMPRAPQGPGLPPFAIPPAEDEGPSLAEILLKLVKAGRFLRRNFRVIAVLAAVGVGLAALSVVFVPPPAEAACLVKLQPQVKSNPMDPQQRYYDDDENAQFFAGAEQAFTRPELVADTLRKMEGQEPDPGRVASTVARLRFEAFPGPAHLFRATYSDKWFGTGRPPAVEFLGVHLRNYLDAEITRALRVFTAESDFLRDQLKSVEAEMDRVSVERAKFRERNADRLPEEASLTHGSRFELESKRAELMAQLRKLQADLDAERQQMTAEGPLLQTKYQASQVYRQSLADINRKLSEAYAAGLAEGHPDVIKLQDEKRRIEQLVNAEMQAGSSDIDRRSNGGLQTIRNRVQALQAQIGAVKNDLSDTEQKLGQVRRVVGDLPLVEEQVKHLTHSQEEITSLHSQLFERLKKAELHVNLERVSAESRYEIVAPPSLVSGGRGKAGLKRGGIGLAAGLAAAAAVLAVREARRLLSQTLATLDRSGRSPSAGEQSS